MFRVSSHFPLHVLKQKLYKLSQLCLMCNCIKIILLGEFLKFLVKILLRIKTETCYDITCDVCCTVCKYD